MTKVKYGVYRKVTESSAYRVRHKKGVTNAYGTPMADISVRYDPDHRNTREIYPQHFGVDQMRIVEDGNGYTLHGLSSAPVRIEYHQIEELELLIEGLKVNRLWNGSSN